MGGPGRRRRISIRGRAAARRVQPGGEGTDGPAVDGATGHGPWAPARAEARALAGAIDLLVVLAGAASLGQPFPPVLVLAIFVAYHATATWWLGRTLGKALLGLRVVRPGHPRTVWWSFARAGPGYLVLGLGGLGLATVAVDPHRRALYDLALGGLVVQDTDAARHPRGVLDRVLEYADEHKRVAGERKKTLGLLGGLWAYLAGVGTQARRLLDLVRGSSAPTGSSVLAHVSSAVAAATAAAATAAAVAVVTVVPAARGGGEWLFTDRYWVGGEPASVAVEEAVAEWMAAHDEPYSGACPPPGDVGGPFSWCTLPAHPISADDDPILRQLGVAEGQVIAFSGAGWYDYSDALLVIEGSGGWRVAAVRRLGDIDEPHGPWLPPEAGVDGVDQRSSAPLSRAVRSSG